MICFFLSLQPHEVDPNFLKTKKRKNEVEPEKKPICPIIQLVPPPPKVRSLTIVSIYQTSFISVGGNTEIFVLRKIFSFFPI